jgi:CheY-like chemotaxis protein
MEKIEKLDCVLLIDDDKITNYIHQITIKKLKINVHIQVAEDGYEAILFLKNKNETPPKPGIIFLDLNMPGMDGWEFMEEYSKLPANQKANAIVAIVTASINPEDEAHSKRYPEIKGYIKKPLTKEKIKETIELFFELGVISS